MIEVDHTNNHGDDVMSYGETESDSLSTMNGGALLDGGDNTTNSLEDGDASESLIQKIKAVDNNNGNGDNDGYVVVYNNDNPSPIHTKDDVTHNVVKDGADILEEGHDKTSTNTDIILNNNDNNRYEGYYQQQHPTKHQLRQQQNIIQKIQDLIVNGVDMKTIKIIVLVFLIANLGFSTYLSYTAPTALTHTFYRVFNISNSQFGALFTIYALPSIFMVSICGILVDVYGPNRVSIVLSSIVTLSTMVSALSPPSYSVMMLSRFLLGFAGESLVSVSNTLMSKWFSDRLLSKCMGVLAGYLYGASLISFAVLPTINQAIGLRLTLWIVFLFAAFGLTLNIIYLLFNRKFKDISKDAEIESMLNNLEINNHGEYKNQIDMDEFFEEELVTSNNSNNMTPTSASITPNRHTLLMANNSMDMEFTDKIIYQLKNGYNQVKTIMIAIPVRMWIMVGIVFSGYSAMYGIAIIGTDYFGVKYGFSERESSLIMSSETVANFLCSPIFGGLIRKVGNRIKLMFTSMVVLAFGIIMLIVTDVYPLPWIIISGIGFSLLNTTIISSIPLFVPTHVTGTAFGFVGTSYNAGLVIFPPILGALKESTGTYEASFYLLFALTLVSMVLIGALKLFDVKSPSETKLD